jgi:hydrogenase-4 membrane subunit HyfE
LGALLAIFSLILSADKSGYTTGMVLFGISVVLVLSGLVGALLQRRTEKEEEARELVNDSLQIYRRTPFEVNAALINKLMQTETNLQELIREKGWEIDEAKLKRLKQIVATNIKKNDLVAAFVSQCQALGLLTSKNATIIEPKMNNSSRTGSRQPMLVRESTWEFWASRH